MAVVAEQGRMDLPKARIPIPLSNYGCTPAEFDEYVVGKALPVLDLRDECAQMVAKIERANSNRFIRCCWVWLHKRGTRVWQHTRLSPLITGVFVVVGFAIALRQYPKLEAWARSQAIEAVAWKQPLPYFFKEFPPHPLRKAKHTTPNQDFQVKVTFDDEKVSVIDFLKLILPKARWK